MDRHAEKLLLELTSLPTASGREQRVIACIERWVKRRKSLTLKRDRFGNVLLHPRGAKLDKALIFAAHMDHPAFVVTEVADRLATAEFRGGVDDAYFKGAVLLHHVDDAPQRGRIVRMERPNGPKGDRVVTVKFARTLRASVGDVMTWALSSSVIRQGKLHAPACDNLAGVAAALCALDQLLKRSAATAVGVLLTRAEEVGFIGALGVCCSRLIPRRARIVVLENSRSFADSPLGGGPIVRLGDRTSTFDPQLTWQLGAIAEQLAWRDKTFRWQRKLMPGGTCEATAYQAMGYTAACLCLPLRNYHNMNADTQRIAPESIDVTDFANLVKLLITTAAQLDDPQASPPLRARLDELFARRRNLLD
ncbi:MAG: M20/M25/M40 family metallo-hydrolase [Phycisphaeraceae bacterium]|nr:M20/M25/M40 family metallo-hydrolase [Phycisphaeraceae bacterium]